MPVSHVGKALDVEYLASGVGDCLSEEGLGILAEACLYLLVIPLGVDEGALDAEFLERNTEQVERASVYIVGRDDVAACLTDIEDCIEIGCLTAGGQHTAYTAFQGGYLLCNGVVGGVCQSCIEVSAVLQVEQACHLVACLVAECGTLIDGELLRLAFFCFPTAVYADGFQVLFHRLLFQITARSYKKILYLAIAGGKKLLFLGSVVYAVVHLLVFHEAGVDGTEVVPEDVFGAQ